MQQHRLRAGIASISVNIKLRKAIDSNSCGHGSLSLGKVKDAPIAHWALHFSMGDDEWTQEHEKAQK